MRLLIVDNSTECQRHLALELGADHEIVATHTAHSAIEHLSRDQFDIVIMDWLLPFHSGKAILDWFGKNPEAYKRTKTWVNTYLPKDIIKRFTNGSRLFTKGQDRVCEAIKQLSVG